MNDLRITRPVLRLLQAFFDEGSGVHQYGLQLSRAAGLKSGTLYPVLARLEGAGWVSSSWEVLDPRLAGRPRRRFYVLTELGNRAGAAVLEESTRPPRP